MVDLTRSSAVSVRMDVLQMEPERDRFAMTRRHDENHTLAVPQASASKEAHRLPTCPSSV